MHIPLSPRLKCCYDFVKPCRCIADIGCDHGYLAISLVHAGIANFAIAVDIRPLPLECAKRNAEKFNLSHKLAFYLSDGVQSIPREFDTLICAGVGADTMVSILQAAPWLKDSRYQLILQCQSKSHLLRRYLSQEGFRILEEELVRDGRFVYTVMAVSYAPGEVLTPGQCYLSPALLKSKSPELAQYCRRTLDQLSLSAQGMENSEEIAALKELAQLMQEESL